MVGGAFSSGTSLHGVHDFLHANRFQRLTLDPWADVRIPIIFHGQPVVLDGGSSFAGLVFALQVVDDLRAGIENLRLLKEVRVALEDNQLGLLSLTIDQAIVDPVGQRGLALSTALSFLFAFLVVHSGIVSTLSLFVAGLALSWSLLVGRNVDGLGLSLSLFVGRNVDGLSLSVHLIISGFLVAVVVAFVVAVVVAVLELVKVDAAENVVSGTAHVVVVAHLGLVEDLVDVEVAVEVEHVSI